MPGTSTASEDTVAPTDGAADSTTTDTTDTTDTSTTTAGDTEDTDTDDQPQSVTITEVTLDESTHVQLAPGSDNWATTWGADGNLYTTWGDGGGFGGTNQVGRVSLGFARIEGSPDDLMAANVWGGAMPENDATFEGKSYGLVSVGGSLFAWVGVQPGNQFATMRLYRSDDYAASWQDTGQEIATSDFGGAFSHPDIISFGMDNGDAPDEYVYVFWNGEKTPGPASSDAIYLTRVPATSIDDLATYEVLSGLAGGAAQWSSDFAERVPAYENAGAIHWVHNVVYVAGLDKYVLINNASPNPADDFPGPDFASDIEWLHADAPWGPFVPIQTFVDWQPPGASEGDRYTFFFDLPGKWQSADGLSFTLVFTGVGQFDSWNTMSGEFTVQTE